MTYPLSTIPVISEREVASPGWRLRTGGPLLTPIITAPTPMYRPLTYAALLFLFGFLTLGTAQAQDASPPDFTLPVDVADDGTGVSQLVFGLSPTASDDYTDPGEDGQPPAPPAGAFYTVIQVPGANGYTTDIRESPAPGMQEDYSLYFRPAVTDGEVQFPVELSWDPSVIPANVDASIRAPNGDFLASIASDSPSTFTIASDSPLVNGFSGDGSVNIRFAVLGPPEAPENLTGSASATSVMLNWQENADDEETIVVERAESGGAFSELVSLGPNTESYTDTSVDPDVTYAYRVFAENALGSSPPSNELTVTTPAANLDFQPESLTLSAAEGGSTSSQSFTLLSSVANFSPTATLSTSYGAGANGWLTVPSSLDAGESGTASVDTQGLTPGTYTATVTAAAGAGFGDAELSVIFNVTDVIETDFTMLLEVSDNAGGQRTLEFGTAPENADQLNVEAPPPPPSGSFQAFDARFAQDAPTNNGFFTKYYPTNTSSVAWTVDFQPSSDGAPVSLSWDPSMLPADGRFTLRSPAGATSPVNIDMRTESAYTVVNISRRTLLVEFSLTTISEVASSRGWNLGALSLDVDDPSFEAVFTNPEPNGMPFTYDGSGPGYENAPTLSPGEGFWVLFDNDNTQSIEGFDIPSVTTDLDAGWNLIGAGTCDLPLTSVQDSEGILEEGTLYGFDRAYQAATTIEQNTGYWISASEDGSITLGCDSEESSALLAATVDAESKLVVRDAAGAQQTLFLDGASGPSSAFKLPPVPPQGAFDVRFRGDERRMNGTTDELRLQAGAFPVQMSLVGSGEDVYEIEVGKDGSAGESYTLTREQSLTLTDPAVSLMRVTQIDDASAPEGFALNGTFPNPFSGSTTLRMDLPQNAVVTVRVFDVLGRQVSQTARSMTAGSERMMTLDGSALASGTYFYRVEAELSNGTVVRTGRMTQVK